MARRTRKAKRPLFAGVLLEIGTLLAIIILAQPSWLAEGLKTLDRLDTSGSPLVEALIPSTDASPVSLPAGGGISDQPVSSPQAEVPVLSRQEWLPGYFDVVDAGTPPAVLVPIVPHF